MTVSVDRSPVGLSRTDHARKTGTWRSPPTTTGRAHAKPALALSPTPLRSPWRWPPVRTDRHAGASRQGHSRRPRTSAMAQRAPNQKSAFGRSRQTQASEPHALSNPYRRPWVITVVARRSAYVCRPRRSLRADARSGGRRRAYCRPSNESQIKSDGATWLDRQLVGKGATDKGP